MKSKGISIAIIVFVCIFGISIVYAASTGVLSMNGTATFIPPSNVELIFTDVDFDSSTPPRNNEEVSLPAGLDNKVMYIDVRLIYPGDKRKVKFKIENLEVASAKLGALITDYESGVTNQTSGIKITWPDLEDEVVSGGTTTGYYEILIEWDIDYYYVIPSSHVFEAAITYQQTGKQGGS